MIGDLKEAIHELRSVMCSISSAEDRAVVDKSLEALEIYLATEQDKKYLIWSNEHNAWWEAGCVGYVDHTHFAGRFTREEALEICNAANSVWDTYKSICVPDELPIEESIAMGLVYKIRGKEYKGDEH